MLFSVSYLIPNAKQPTGQPTPNGPFGVFHSPWPTPQVFLVASPHLDSSRHEDGRRSKRIAESERRAEPSGSPLAASRRPHPPRPALRGSHGCAPATDPGRHGSVAPPDRAPLPLPACPRSPRRVTGGRPRPLAASAEADNLHGSIHPNQLRQLELVLAIADLICSFQRIRGNQIPLYPFVFAMFYQMSNCQLQKSSYGHTQL